MPTLAQDLMHECEDDVYALGMRAKKLVQVCCWGGHFANCVEIHVPWSGNCLW